MFVKEVYELLDKFDENLNRDDNKLKCFCFCHFNNNHIDSICSLTRTNSGSTDGDSNSSFFSFRLKKLKQARNPTQNISSLTASFESSHV